MGDLGKGRPWKALKSKPTIAASHPSLPAFIM